MSRAAHESPAVAALHALEDALWHELDEDRLDLDLHELPCGDRTLVLRPFEVAGFSAIVREAHRVSAVLESRVALRIDLGRLSKSDPVAASMVRALRDLDVPFQLH